MKNKIVKISILFVIVIALIIRMSYTSANSSTFEESLKKVITIGTKINVNDGFSYARGQFLKKEAIFNNSSVSEKLLEKEYTIFKYSVDGKKYTFNIDIESMRERLKNSGSFIEEDGHIEEASTNISNEIVYEILESCYIAVADYETTDLSKAYTYFAQQLDDDTRKKAISVNNDVFSYIIECKEPSNIKQARLVVNADKMKNFNIDSTKDIYTVLFRNDPELQREDIANKKYISYCLDAFGSQRYTGKPIDFQLEGIYDLREGKDYIVTYKDNINPGQAYVIITGIGKYKGIIVKPFRILPAKVQNVKVKSQTDKSITLKWSKSGGEVTGYRIYEYNEKTKKYDKRLVDTTKTTYAINKLSSGRTYKFQITAYKLIGKKTYEGLYSKTITTTTKTKTPGISKIIAGKKKMTVKFKKVSGANGYQIQYSLEKKFKKGNKIINVSKKVKSKTISKLKSNKKYYVRIRAYRTVNGKKVYSSYSLKKNVKIK